MKVLFMCTANSCRSILSEGLFNHSAGPGYTAVSSGSFPSGKLNPRAVKTLEGLGINTAELYSKGSEVFCDSPPDVVITVCDKAGGEPCPVYFGPAVKGHWGLADPSEVEGADSDEQSAFDTTVARIRKRLDAFFRLDHSALTPEQLKCELDRIGEL